MKFGQLIEYKMRNNFLRKLYPKCGGQTNPRPFSEKCKIKHISGAIVLNLIQFVFIVCQVEGYGNILKLSCSPLVFTSYWAFLKNINRPGTGHPTSFSA